MAFWIRLENVRCWRTASGNGPLAGDDILRGVAARIGLTEQIDLEQSDPQNWVRVGPFHVRIVVDRISFTRNGHPTFHVRSEGGPVLPVGGDVEHGQWFYWTLPFVVSTQGEHLKGPYRGHFDLVW